MPGELKNNPLNIAYQPGFHGNYLRYFLDRFSALTPAITETPFVESGNSHNNKIKYSKLIIIYHPIRENYKFKNEDQPHIFITIEEKDLLYLYRCLHTRQVEEIDRPDIRIKVENEKVIFSPYLEKLYSKKIQNIYNYNTNNKLVIPKFIFRDLIKLNFLNIKDDEVLQDNLSFKKKAPNNTLFFPISAFWEFDNFFKNIQKINQKFNLQIEINDQAKDLHKQFLNTRKDYNSKDRIKTIIDCIKNRQNYDLTTLDVFEEGYLSAWIESNFKFKIIPNTNSFFKDVNELLEYLDWYPQHYQAMNPNLPTFNGIPNPFYLHKNGK
jgi:hypothetical protein